MKLFLLKRIDYIQWDMYISFIVCAEDEESAKNLMPGDDGEAVPFNKTDQYWVRSKSKIKCTELGTANEGIEQSIILSSFAS